MTCSDGYSPNSASANRPKSHHERISRPSGIRGRNRSINFELNGSIGYSDLGDGADGTAFNAGALYSFTPTFAIEFGIGIDEDVTLYGLGGRFYFGN
jgi:hypothetical protein